MIRLTSIKPRLRTLFRKRRFEKEMDDELRMHVELMIHNNIQSGMSHEEARHAALLSFGGMDLTKENCRDTLWTRWLNQFCQDLFFGLRMMRKSPGFTVVAVLTLAIGIGANSAIFSAVNGILLRPLPYSDTSSLVTIHREQIAWGVTPPQLQAIQQQCTALERLATYSGSGSLLIAGGTGSRQVSAAYISGDFFSIMGVKPLLGRPIISDDTGSNEHVAVLSHGLWMEQFGGDPDIVGKSIIANRMPYTVIGIMPREFGVGISISYSFRGFDGSYDAMWIPQVLPPPEETKYRYSQIIARLKKDATLEQLNAQLQPLSDRFEAEYPVGTEALKLYARSLEPGIGQRVQTGLLILSGAVGFVLLLACVNVSSLLLARSWTREKELGIRKALGASRWRILRQYLTESLMLALMGGTLGLLLSLWGAQLLRVIAPPNTPRVDYIRLDGNVLWFTAGISLLVTVLVGLAPTFQAWSRKTDDMLKSSLSDSFLGTAVKRPHRLRSSLIVLEVFLVFILVAGGALMGRSFYKLMSVNTGIDADHVLTMYIQFPNLSGRDPATRGTTSTNDILDGIRSLSEVQLAALTNGNPFSGGNSIGYYPGSPLIGLFVEGIEDNQLPAGQWIYQRSVTPDFYNALGIRILKGRAFNAEDLTSPVAVISESFARRYIPGNPIGKRFNIDQGVYSGQSWLEIVGIVNDVRDHSIEGPSPPLYYTPFSQPGNRFGIIAQSSANPLLLVPTIKRILQSFDPDVLITSAATVEQLLAASAAESRFQTTLVGLLGIFGFILAMIGIYGITSYSVHQQTHEIGVRMALGAGQRDVIRLILREGFLLVIVGIAIGIAGAFGLTRVLRSMLFEIEPTDPATFVGVAIFLAIAALVACYFPARRAVKADPMAALRHE